MSMRDLPKINDWLAEMNTLDEAARPARLEEMRRLTRAEGGCGSLQTHNGLPCRRSPKIGYTVCRTHGERAPQTIAKAERLLAVARIPVIEGILDEIDQSREVECDTCGYPNGGLKYRKYIAGLRWQLLNRVGMGPRQTIDVNARQDDASAIDVSSFTAEELEELDRVLALMDELQARVKLRLSRENAEHVMSGLPAAKLLTSMTDGSGQGN